MKWVGSAILVLVLISVGLATLRGEGVKLAPPAPRVYSVVVVQAGLQRHPHVWGGRIVRVRGWITGSGGTSCIAMTGDCVGTWIRLMPTTEKSKGSAELDVVLPMDMSVSSLSPHPSASILWRLPIVGRLLLAQNMSSTLRVRLMMTASTCVHTPGPCATGLLVP